MVERPTKVAHNDKMVDAFDVPVGESIERWCEFTLEDGTVIRAKTGLLSVARLKDEYDEQGKPIYVLNLSGTIIVASVPDTLLKKS
jgi:hypothetical protein